MLVHFVGSRYNIVENIDRLRQIVKVIHEQEHVLARDWLEPAYSSRLKGDAKSLNWNEAYKDAVEAITKADVVIADASIRSFSVGFQVALATQMKKPTLVLCESGADDSFFAGGIDTGLTYKEYTKNDLEGIVAAFLKENDIQAKDMRFNFFIDRPIYNYLRWAAYKTGKTKAEILRELVSKEIDKANDINQL
jgi:hypothetical protein